MLTMSLLKSLSTLRRTSCRILSGLYPKLIFSEQPNTESPPKTSMLVATCKGEGERGKYKIPYLFMLALPVVSKGAASEEEDTPLIAKIKQSLKSMEKQEMTLAERQLHAALKMARDQKNYMAANHILSLMANLSYSVEDYAQAEMIYVDLLQKYITLGYDYDNIKVMNISLKLAMIFAMTDQHEKALAGYDFCVDKLKARLDDGCTEVDVMTLYGMAQESYGNYLLRGDLYDEAEERLLIAHEMCLEVKGPTDLQTAVLLNALAKVAMHKKNYDKATLYFERAIEIAKEHNDTSQVVFLINLARLKLLEGFTKVCASYCKQAMEVAQLHKNEDLKLHADFCFASIKEHENAAKT